MIANVLVATLLRVCVSVVFLANSATPVHEKEARQEVANTVLQNAAARQNDGKNASELRLIEEEIRVAEKKLREDHPVLKSLAGVEAWYLVGDNHSLTLLRGGHRPDHQAYIDLMRLLAPPQEAVHLTTFVIRRHVERKSDVISMGTTVYTGVRKPEFGIAVNRGAIEQLIAVGARNIPTLRRALVIQTLIHEYAGHGVFATFRDRMNRQTGCLNASQGGEAKDSLARMFAVEFWGMCAHGARTRSRSDFVSSYARTDAYEDFAESIVAFVSCEEPRASRTSVIARKLRWFAAQPRLAAYRAHVRSVLIREELRAVAGLYTCS